MSQTATTTHHSEHVSDAAGIFELSRLSTSSRNTSGRILSSATEPKRDFVAPQEERAENGADVPGDSDPPTSAYTAVERWNYPRGNIGRIVFAFVSAMVAGMNDAAVGPLLPYLEDYYGLGKTVVSLVFLTPFLGYSVAAFTNARIHVKFGQRGIAVMAPLCHILTYAVLSAHPPYPVLIVVNAVSGFGNGLTDACFCAWVGAMDKANTIQGFLHACYSLGALFSPLIATSMVVKGGLPWFNFYYVLVGVSVLELIGLSFFFWDKTGAVYQAEHARENENAKGAGTRDALRSPVTWLCAAFFFAYMGVEVGLGGWIVSFMLNVRNASPYASGISGTGFWAGMALGRAVLGFVTERFGERLCLIVYLALCIALELLFWLVPEFLVSAVAVAFLGFFLGPMFPGAVMVTAKLLPKRIHVSAIGFAMSMGGTGSTVFPFIIGAAASSKGVQVLQPIILSLIAVVSIVWVSFPRIKKQE